MRETQLQANQSNAAEWNRRIDEVKSDCGQLMQLVLEMIQRNQDVGGERGVRGSR